MDGTNMDFVTIDEGHAVGGDGDTVDEGTTATAFIVEAVAIGIEDEGGVEAGDGGVLGEDDIGVEFGAAEADFGAGEGDMGRESGYSGENFKEGIVIGGERRCGIKGGGFRGEVGDAATGPWGVIAAPRGLIPEIFEPGDADTEPPHDKGEQDENESEPPEAESEQATT